MKRLFILLTMIVILLSACGGTETSVVNPVNTELEAEVSDLQDENVACKETLADQDAVINGLGNNLDVCLEDYSASEEFGTSCKATIANQDELVTALIDQVDACVAEYDELFASIPEPVEEVVEEPAEDPYEEYSNPDYPSHTCVLITADNVPIFYSTTNANGKVKVNANGNMILKRLSVADVKWMAKDWLGWEYVNLKDTGRYQVNDTVCISDNPIQADGGRVLLLISGPFSRHYIPVSAIKQP